MVLNYHLHHLYNIPRDVYRGIAKSHMMKFTAIDSGGPVDIVIPMKRCQSHEFEWTMHGTTFQKDYS